jgi:hypothetical protein
MKTLSDYIIETETTIDQPQAGDAFDIEVAPDHLIETVILEATEDSVLIQGDEILQKLLESRGHAMEHIGTYGAVGYGGMGQTFFEKDGEQIDEHGGGIGPKQHWQDMMEQPVDEGKVKDLSIELDDYQRMTPQQFYAAYGQRKADWAMAHQDFIQKHGLQTDWSGTSGFDYVRETSAYMSRMLELAGVSDHKFDKEDQVYHEDNSGLLDKSIKDAPVSAMGELPEQLDAQEPDEEIDEAEYQGRKVSLGKPMRGDVKKFKVYVKDPKTGNIKKVNFGHGGTSAKRAGQKTMKIKKSNPARRRSFRARHNCDNPGPRTKARYWSCRAW